MAKYRAELRKTHVGSAYDQYLLDTDSRCVANNFDNTSTDFSATNRPALKPGESLDQSMIKIDKLLKNLKTFSFNNPATTLNLNDNSTDAIYGKKVINDEVNKNSIVDGLFQTGFANLGVAIDPTSKTYTGLTGDQWTMPFVGVSTSTGGGSTAGQKKLYYGKPWLKINKNSSGYDEISLGIMGQTYSKATLPVTVENYTGTSDMGVQHLSSESKILGRQINSFDGLLLVAIPNASIFDDCEAVYVGMSNYGKAPNSVNIGSEKDYTTTHRKMVKGIDYNEDGLMTLIPVCDDGSNYVSIIGTTGRSIAVRVQEFDYTITKIITN